MTKVLITGAGGYIGSNVAEYFVQHGFEVTGMVHRKIVPRFAETQAEAIHADLCDFSSLDRLFENHDYEYVIHIAARASDVGRREWFRIQNFEAAKYLATLSMKHDVKRFVYMSTSDVYGLRDFHGETEEELSRGTDIRNYYPLFKVYTEEWIEKNLPTGRWAFVRPFIAWGNGDTSITPRVIGFLKTSPYAFHFGKWKGKNRCALAHVRNISAATHAAMLLPEMAGGAVHVLDPEFTSWSDYYRMIHDRFLPEKPYREMSLPTWTIRPWAKVISAVSTLLGLYVPFSDPSDYALDTMIRNIDVSSEKMCRLIEAVGESVLHTPDGEF